MIAQRHLEPSRCRCGAEAAHPLPICTACYATIQESQRNRGRHPVITGNTPSGRKWRLAQR